MNFSLSKIISRKDLLLLFSIWLAVQTSILFINGIKTDGEAGRVIREATNLLNDGHFSAPNFYMYFTEIFLVYLSKILGLSFWVIVFIQLLVNAAALYYFNDFLGAYYHSKKLALIGSLLLIFCYPYQIYNSFLYTESLFFSLSIFYSIYLIKIKQFSVRNSSVLLILLLLLCITRPTGIFFAGASIVYLFFRLANIISPLKSSIIFIVLTCVTLIILNKLMASGGGIDIILPFKDERIICEVPSLPYEVNIKTIENSNSLYGLFYYITNNPNQFFRLALLKTKAFFGLYRPYYSTLHNLFIVGFFFPLYAFILLAIARFKKSTPLSFIYFVSITLITWISVVFSCDEWHNRFFLTLTPFLIVPAVYLFIKKPATE